MNVLLAHRRGIITGLLIAAAAYVLAGSLRDLTFLQRQLSARQTERTALERHRGQVAEHRAAFDWLEGNTREEDRLTELVKRHLTSIPHDLAMRERTENGEAWSFQRYDLRIERIDADTVGRFLAACENARPPVRLIDIQVSAAATAERQLTLQLALAEITKKAAGSP